MKKFTLLLSTMLLFVLSWQGNAQVICTQTFSGSGQDDDPTVVTVNTADITCNSGETINSITLVNPADTLIDSDCAADGSGWYNFTLNIDGTDVITGCGSDFDGYVVPTSFSTLTITSTDSDAYSDSVIITFDLEIDYVGCPAPTALNTTNLTATSADLNWTAASGAVDYNWEVQPQGTAQGTAGATASGTGVTGTTVNTGNTLTADTYYDFFVQTNCGGSTSTWAGPFTFYTGYCVSNPSSNDGNGISNVQISATNFANGDVTYFDYTGTVVDIAQNTLANLQITFETGYTYDTNVWIDFNDNLEFEASEQVFDGVSTSTNPTTLDASFNVDAAAALGNHRMRIGTADSGQETPDPCYNGTYGVTLDFMVNVTPPPACLTPTDLNVTNITATSADLNWTAVSGAVDYNWEVQPQGTAQGTAGATASGTAVAGTTVNTGATLSSNTSYDFFVQTNCGGSGTSTWAGPVTFTTLCGTFSAPYTEDFEDGGALDACWSQSATDNLDWTVNSGGTTSSNTGPSAANGGTYYVYVETSLAASNDTAELLSPNIDLSTLTTPRLNFFYHMYGGGMDPDGTIDVAITTDNGTTYTSVFNQIGNQGDQWNNGIVDLSAYSGVVSFKITGTISSTGLVYENDFAIDDFSIEETPTCTAPTDLAISNLTATSSDITWTDGIGVTNNTITVTPSITGSPFTVAAGVETISLSGLDANTEYTVEIANDCDANAKDTITLITLPDCASNPNIADGAIDVVLTPNNNGDLLFTWDSVAGAVAVQYEFWLGTTSGSLTQLVPNADNTGFTVTGMQSSTQYYWQIIPTNSAGSAIGCSEWSFTTADPTAYCDPSDTGTNTTTFIDDFTTSNGNVNISNTSSGLGTDHYEDNYATMSVSSYQNGSFDFSVSIQDGTVGCAIWVDWNNDFIYDTATETVFNTTSYTSGPFTGTINIPSNVTDGDYHMRVMIDWNDSNPDDNACELNIGRGEIEDYKITVESDLACSGTVKTWDGSAWSPSIPTIDDPVVINGDYDTATSGSFEACTLTVNTPSTLWINSGGYIKVNSNIETSGDILIDTGGSLVQVDDTAFVNVLGAATVTTEVITSPMDDPRYSYFSSPTQGSTTALFSSWAQMSRIFTWDGPTTQDWIPVGTAEAMNIGQGYIVRPSGTAAYSSPQSFTTNFDGAFNNGVITQPLYYDVSTAVDLADNDNALVGNPYPSGIDTAALLALNTNANSFYFWAHTVGGDWQNESYRTWNASGSTDGAPANIAVGQGFFVTTGTANPGDFTFNNSVRSTTVSTFFRPATSDLDKVWLNLANANNTIGNQILVAFNPICTDGFDLQYDATNFSTAPLAFASKGTDAQTQNLVIQTRGELTTYDTVIPLRIEITDSTILNDLVMSIDHFENLDYSDIYVRDLDNNILHDLKQGDFIFSLSQVGVNDARFELVFSRNALSVNDATLSNDDLIIANQDSNNFKVKMINGAKITNFKAFDVVGKLVVNMDANSNNFTVNNNLKQGTVLFVKATLENGQVLTKKFIKL